MSTFFELQNFSPNLMDLDLDYFILLQYTLTITTGEYPHNMPALSALPCDESLRRPVTNTSHGIK